MCSLHLAELEWARRMIWCFQNTGCNCGEVARRIAEARAFCETRRHYDRFARFVRARKLADVRCFAVRRGVLPRRKAGLGVLKWPDISINSSFRNSRYGEQEVLESGLDSYAYGWTISTVDSAWERLNLCVKYQEFHQPVLDKLSLQIPLRKPEIIRQLSSRHPQSRLKENLL